MLKEMDIYSDYLLSSFGQVTATGLSSLLEGSMSHDKITRFLSGKDYDSKDLWQAVKPLVRSHENENSCLIFDDTIIKKPYTDENDLICWHWDHSNHRNEKGINLLSAFYHTDSCSESEPLRVPVAFECVKKTAPCLDTKTGKDKRKSPITKNEMMRSMIEQAVKNMRLKFRYVLADSWFSASDNMLFINKLKKYFVMDMKTNRLCMFSSEDRNKGQWTSLDKLSLEPGHPVKVWIKGLKIEVLLCKFVFRNKDGSMGVMYLVSNDLELSADSLKSLYNKRWGVEEYHN
jgi:hypothetical protein